MLPEEVMGPGRLIIIGDVHGCVKELRELLDEAEYVEGEDTVVLVGDLVDKGPYPLEVSPPNSHLNNIAWRKIHSSLMLLFSALPIVRETAYYCSCFQRTWAHKVSGLPGQQGVR